MRFARPFALAAVALSVTLTTGCGAATAPTGAPNANNDGRIVVANFRAPVSNWALETDDAYILSIAGCLETMTRYDQTQQKVVPMLSESWEQTAAKQWDFKLRAGVKFQDGTPMDAKAVAGSLNHVLAAIAPARAFNSKFIDAVKEIDATTVRITTVNEDPLLPYRVASVNTGILSPASYTDKGIDPFGHCTGPFEPVSEKPSQSLTVDRNSEYWGGKVALAGGEIRFIAEGATRATQVQTGEADISMSIPAASLDALDTDKSLSLEKTDSPRTATLYMNNSRAPFNNVELRRAAQLSLDLNAISSSVYEGAAAPATGPFAPSEPWANKDLAVPQQDLEKARKLVAESGYKAGKPLEVIAIVERAEFADVAAIIQANFAEAGLEVSVVTKEYGAVEPDLLAGNYDMVLSQRNRMIDIANPIGFLQADYTCEGSYNLSHYCNVSYDKLVQQAGSETDEKLRNELYRKAGDILAGDVANVWVVNEQAIDGVRNEVQGYVQDPLTRYILTATLSKSS